MLKTLQPGPKGLGMEIVMDIPLNYCKLCFELCGTGISTAETT